MARHSLVLGKVVQLRSDGPKMTVTSVDEEGATTVWMDMNLQLQTSWFAAVALRESEEVY